MKAYALRILVALTIYALAHATHGADHASPSPPARLPNVVLIVSDDQGYADYGFMSHPHIRTPHLDKLARESLTFRRAYVPSSVCRPSLVSILTGQYPHQHKITSNDPPPAPTASERHALRLRQIAYIDDAPTLPRLLATKGYVSLQTGKWWEGDCQRGGFTHGMSHGDPARKGRHGDEGLQIGRNGIEPIRQFLDETAGKPFFIWYAPMMPHNPHNASERFLAHYRGKAGFHERAKYWAMCEWFDETCGELLDELDERGLAENTIVAYVTDNGWISARGTYKQAPRSKMSPYDGGLRTPIMLRWPDRINPQMVDTPVSSIDLAPTILKIVGIEPPADMMGIDLRDAESVAGRKSIFGETFAHEAVDVDRPATCLQYRWCVSWPWKLIQPNTAVIQAGKPELYLLAEDPTEQRDLAADHPDVAERLTRGLDAWWDPAADATVGE